MEVGPEGMTDICENELGGPGQTRTLFASQVTASIIFLTPMMLIARLML